MPLSPNMNLPIPVPSQTGGPQYALDEQSCFQQIDSHNHTPGQGSQIPLNALNINQNLSMSGYSITSLKSLQLQNQAISPGSSSLYMSGNDLYFSDGTGAFNVQITSGNAVAVSGAVGFSGLPSGTASAAYLSVLGTFRFQSATNTAAALDVGPIKLRNPVAGSDYIGITPPFPLPSGYVITLPTGVPASNKILQMGAGGEIFNVLDVDGSTIQIVGNNIQLGTLPANSVGTTQIIDANVTPAKLSSTTLLQDATNLSTSFSFVWNDAANHLLNSTKTLYTKTFNGVAGRPVIFNMAKNTSSVFQMELFWQLVHTPSSGFQIFGGFGFPGPQIQGWMSINFNGVEVSRMAYKAYSNGNYATGTENWSADIFPLILVPSSTGSQTITITLTAYGMIYGNGSITWNAYSNNINYQVITF